MRGGLDWQVSRRQLLQSGGAALGLTLPDLLQLRSTFAGTPSTLPGFGQAKSCIVLFCWGGVSHLETWDPKPEAPAEVRGDYKTIGTATPGLFLGEYMQQFALQTERLAIVRSIHHPEAGHRNAAYWNLTGHAPHTPGNDDSIEASRRDWPCLGAQVAKFRTAPAGFPGSVCIPYPIADRGLLNGQYGGFLGMNYDPLIVHPGTGTAYKGVSPNSGTAQLRLIDGVVPERMQRRMGLLGEFDTTASATRDSSSSRAFEYFRDMAADLLLSPQVTAAFDLQREPAAIRNSYGNHVCGQSALLARRLTGAGIPLVTVYASAGDLNGSAGDNWDTHGNNFNRLKNDLLPPLEQASVALLDDLDQSGRLNDTLVVWLTEFGRTPHLRGAGRDHYPLCYSVALAGAGIRGGQVYGSSDRIAALPADNPCGPHDLHATVFHALGIPSEAQVADALGRPLALTDGRPLPLFG